LLTVAAALPAAAHMMSLSTGDLRVDGNKVIYELRIPSYEVTHLSRPDQELLASVRFTNRGVVGRLVEKNCRPREDENAYVCQATWEFPAPVETLEMECRLARVTVPNHVHVLRAAMGDKTDQAVFDFSMTKAELRFRPPTTLERAVEQSAGGVVRALGGAPQLLFLIALALAARRRAELVSLYAMFQAGKLVAVWVVPLSGWSPAPRFAEAAAALTVAYLAVEILLLPEAGKRWLVVGGLGLFQGLPFVLYLNQTQYSAWFVQAGAAAAEALVLIPCWWGWGKLALLARGFQPARIAASLLLAAGMIWFAVRLRG